MKDKTHIQVKIMKNLEKTEAWAKIHKLVYKYVHELNVNETYELADQLEALIQEEKQKMLDSIIRFLMQPTVSGSLDEPAQDAIFEYFKALKKEGVKEKK